MTDSIADRLLISAAGSARGERRLSAALNRLGIVPAVIEPLTALHPWARVPRTYLVTTDTGARVKIRFARRARLAERAARLTGALADPRVAPPLAVSSTAMLEGWIEGDPLSTVALCETHLDAAADILSAVHTFGTGRHRRTAPLVSRIGRNLAEIVAAGMVTAASAEQLQRLVSDSLPAEASWGLIHNDFCDENLVVGPDGTLASIDNELVCWGFLDYDLARTWYRWPLPEWAEDRFARRYVAASGRAQHPEQAPAWRALATIRALRIRLRTQTAPKLETLALSRILENVPARP